MAKGTLTVRIIGDAKSFKGALGDASSKLGGFAKGAAVAGAALGTAGIAAGVGLGKLAAKTADYADEAAKGARATGLSVEGYQELRFAMGQAGVDGDKFRNMMRTFNKQTGEAAGGNKMLAGTFDDLGIKLKDAGGAWRSQDDIFTDTIASLETLGSTQEVAAAASKLFGARIGGELASAIATGGDGIEALRDKAQDLGIVMSEDTAVAGEAFNDAMDAMKQRATGMANALGAKVMPALTTVMDGFADGGLAGGFAAIGDMVRDAVPKLLAALSDMATAAGEWITSTALPWIGEKLAGLGDALTGWATDSSPGLLGNLDGVFASVSAWITDTALPALKTKLAEWATAFGEWAAEAVPPLLAKLMDLRAALFTWIMQTALPALIDKLAEFAQAFVEWVGPAIAELLPELGKFLGATVRWIIFDALPKAIVALAKLAWAFLDWIVTGVIPELPGILAGLLRGVIAFLGEALGPIGDKLAEWGTTFVGWVTGLPAKISSAASGLFDGIKDAFRGAVNWIIRKWNDLSFSLPSVKVPGLGEVGGFTLRTPDIPLLARGGTAVTAGAAIVGDAGPELLELPVGARVTPLPRVAAERPDRRTVTEQHVHINGWTPSPAEVVDLAVGEFAWMAATA